MLQKDNEAEFQALTSLDGEFLTIRFEREEIESILQHIFDARDFQHFVSFVIQEGTIITLAKNLTDLMKDLLPAFETDKQQRGLES